MRGRVNLGAKMLPRERVCVCILAVVIIHTLISYNLDLIIRNEIIISHYFAQCPQSG